MIYSAISWNELQLRAVRQASGWGHSRVLREVEESGRALGDVPHIKIDVWGTRLISATTPSLTAVGSFIAKFNGGMGAVAEGLVFRLTATAERYTIAYLVFKAVGRYYSDAPAQPDRPAASLLRIFDQTD